MASFFQSRERQENVFSAQYVAGHQLLRGAPSCLKYSERYKERTVAGGR